MSAKKSPAIVLCLCLCLQQSYLYAQEKSKVQFGKVAPADFILPSSPIIDSNTRAVIISDAGSIHFVGNENGWFSPVYKRQTRIKIINKEAIKAATVVIPLYGVEDHYMKLDAATGSTYNLENGKVVETRLGKGDIFKEKVSKDLTAMKFTLPAVKEGSIIEYSYTYTSARVRDLPEWEFQSDEYPCLWSELDVTIPQTLSYALVKQGIHSYLIDKGSEGSESYKVVEKAEGSSLAMPDRTLIVSTKTIKHYWAMKDIPAFHVENYISTAQNYIDKMQFQLSGTYNGEEKTDVSNSWKSATEEWLTRSYYFGQIRDDNDWLNDQMDKIVANTSGQLEQAKAIYYYVNSKFTCTNHNYAYVTTTLKDVWQKHSGTVGDLNLVLIAMLRKEHITADPVLLSTRENGFNFPRYPIQEKMNYSIVRASIDGKIVYLDAAHPQLGFGQLDADCYNGYARIISEQDSGSVYFSPDSLKENRTTMVMVTNSEKGLEGTYQSTLGPQESYQTRKEVGELGEKKYFLRIQAANGEDMEISNTGIDSLKKPEEPIKINYDFVLRPTSDANVFYLNPMFNDGYRKNPFTSLERKYPVEMPYASDDTYIFNMEIPAGFRVDELPKSVKVALNGNEGLFEYMLSADQSNIQLRVRVLLNRAQFFPDDYGSLRDFFGYIVKKESEQIVLKKK